MSSIFDKLVESRVAASSENIRSKEESPSDAGVTSTRDSLLTPAEVKLAAQELLKHGFIEETARTDLFRSCIIHADAIQRVLEPFDLTLKVDSHRGVAFLAVAQVAKSNESDEEDGWSHPLVRKQRLTLEQSLLLAILRQSFAVHEQEFGVGQAIAKTAIDDLTPSFLAYFGDSGSDAKNESRLLQLLDQLKTHGVVSEVDKQQELIIRPLIAHVANPESLTALLQVLKEKSQPSSEKAGGK
ncbi:MAG: DUF4194 domain-containing protein [Pirellulales bacterium]